MRNVTIKKVDANFLNALKSRQGPNSYRPRETGVRETQPHAHSQSSQSQASVHVLQAAPPRSLLDKLKENNIQRMLKFKFAQRGQSPWEKDIRFDEKYKAIESTVIFNTQISLPGSKIGPLLEKLFPLAIKLGRTFRPENLDARNPKLKEVKGQEIDITNTWVGKEPASNGKVVKYHGHVSDIPGIVEDNLSFFAGTLNFDLKKLTFELPRLGKYKLEKIGVYADDTEIAENKFGNLELYFKSDQNADCLGSSPYDNWVKCNIHIVPLKEEKSLAQSTLDLQTVISDFFVQAKSPKVVAVAELDVFNYRGKGFNLFDKKNPTLINELKEKCLNQYFIEACNSAIALYDQVRALSQQNTKLEGELQKVLTSKEKLEAENTQLKSELSSVTEERDQLLVDKDKQKLSKAAASEAGVFKAKKRAAGLDPTANKRQAVPRKG